MAATRNGRWGNIDAGRSTLIKTILVLAAALALSAAAGCAGQAATDGAGTTTLSLEEGARLMREHVQGLQDKSYVVRTYVNGRRIRTYYQDGTGDWRVEAARESDSPGQASTGRQGAGQTLPENLRSSAMIYNAREAKIWVIVGNTAYEMTDPGYLKNEYQSAAPITTAITAPKWGHYTQAGENDIWELRASPEELARQRTETFGITSKPQPGEEIWNRYEFLGPEGLLSRMSAGPIKSGPDGPKPSFDKTFEYSQVGDVPPDLFELPANVTEVKSLKEYFKQLRDSGWVPHEDRGD